MVVAGLSFGIAFPLGAGERTDAWGSTRLSAPGPVRAGRPVTGFTRTQILLAACAVALAKGWRRSASRVRSFNVKFPGRSFLSST